MIERFWGNFRVGGDLRQKFWVIGESCLHALQRIFLYYSVRLFSLFFFFLGFRCSELVGAEPVKRLLAHVAVPNRPVVVRFSLFLFGFATVHKNCIAACRNGLFG